MTPGRTCSKPLSVRWFLATQRRQSLLASAVFPNSSSFGPSGAGQLLANRAGSWTRIQDFLPIIGLSQFTLVVDRDGTLGKTVRHKFQGAFSFRRSLRLEAECLESRDLLVMCFLILDIRPCVSCVLYQTVTGADQQYSNVQPLNRRSSAGVVVDKLCMLCATIPILLDASQIFQIR